MRSRGTTSLRRHAAVLLSLGPSACFSDSGDLSAGPPSSSSGEGSSTSTGGPTTGGSSSSPSSSSAGPGSSSDASSSTGTPDQDGDAVPDAEDNCPAAPNEHQLDFDGDAIGNVCDEPLRYAVIDGAPPVYNEFGTKGSVDAGMGLVCEFLVELVAVSADVQLTLDDLGAAELSVSSLRFADTPAYTCTLGSVTFKAALEDLHVRGDALSAVSFPFTLGDHDAGSVTGATDAAYTAPLEGVINVVESNAPVLVPVGPSPLVDANFTFPKGQVTASLKALAFKFDDDATIVFEHDQLAPVRLTGLTGALSLTM